MALNFSAFGEPGAVEGSLRQSGLWRSREPTSNPCHRGRRCADGVDFAKRAREAGSPLQLQIGEKMPHCFQMQHSLVPQAAVAAERVILTFFKPSSF